MKKSLETFLFAASLISPCCAQENVKLVTGYVRDTQRVGISHVQVTADNASPTETDGDGYFRLQLKPSVQIGELVWLHFEKTSYSPADQQTNYAGQNQKPLQIKLEKIENQSAPLLIINPFYTAEGKLLPGNEHVLKSPPVLTDSKVPVLQSGATLVTTIARRGPGSTPITLSRLELRCSFHPGPIANFKYDYGPSNLFGRGIIEALSYVIKLDGDSVFVAQSPRGAADKPIVLSPQDLLADDVAVALTPESSSQVVKIHLGASRDGLYELHLVAIWSAGGPNQETDGQKILLYREED